MWHISEKRAVGRKLYQCLRAEFAAEQGSAGQAGTGIKEIMWKGLVGSHRVLPWVTC